MYPYLLPTDIATAPGLGFFLVFVVLLAVWTVVIKGFALWHAARGEQRLWFVALLLINTLGILEIVYLLWFRARKADTIAEQP